MFGPKVFRYATLASQEQADLKARNWAQWCDQAAKERDRGGKICIGCNWPLDDMPVNPNNPENRYVPDLCLVCISMNAVISQSAYFRRLEREEGYDKKRMGLNGPDL